MADSMKFGPDWIRNLSSEGSTGTPFGGSGGGTRYQLAEYRYGREEMLALFDKNSKPPTLLTNFKCLYSETGLLPLALLPTTEDETSWQGNSGRPSSLLGGPPRGRGGGALERGGGRLGGRPGRGGYQQYVGSGRATGTVGYDGGWGGGGEQSEWSPRKEYNTSRSSATDNWRRSRINGDDDEGWRSGGAAGLGRGSHSGSASHDKWVRSTSWRGDGDSEERIGISDRGIRSNSRIPQMPSGRRSWDGEDRLPEWATENPAEGGGSFDDKGAFHGSDDEQLEGKPPNRRENSLQKSTSQQHISNKNQHPPLSSSKSTMSLVKPEETSKKGEDPTVEIHEENKLSNESSTKAERKKSVPNIPEKVDKEVTLQERAKSEGPPKSSSNKEALMNGPLQDLVRNEESDFEKLQEDFVLKLVVDEEPPKQNPSSFEMGNIPAPPNLVPPVVQDKWFYQDPQGQMQGPFSSIEMAEWYKAGYFSNQLKVRRHQDERFFLLGELIAMCGGVNPFQTVVRFPALKNDVAKMPDPDLLQFQYLSQMAAYKQAQARILAEPWSALTLQQQEIAAQRLMQQQVPQDLQYIQPPPTANPLMHMINQMQQANKLPGQGLVDKQPPNIPVALDPHLQLHMGNLLSMQSRLPASGLTNSIPTGLTPPLPGALPPENHLPTSMPSLQTAAANLSGGNGLPMTTPRPPSQHNSSVDQISAVGQEGDPISSLLKQLQQQKQQQQVDSLWQQTQYHNMPSSSTVPTSQWQTTTDVPLSMWDLQQNGSQPTALSSPKSQQKTENEESQQQQSQQQRQQQHHQKLQQPQPQMVKQQKSDKDQKDQKAKEDSQREAKKKKEQEEKQAKKEAEEKRKQEQKRQEAEKKAAEEKKRKEEERIRKELEKAKKEAEEKRLKELEEKRKLKEQRKAEEEARKKAEEEKIKQELKEAEANRQAEARKQAEEKRIQQDQSKIVKVAPWSQSNSTLGMSLAEIQKAEKERKAQDAAMQMQKLQEKELQQQQHQEKNSGLQLNWAKKPVEPRKVKSLAEIQAEEQERLAKQAAESRLQKEKEAPPVTNNMNSIWSSQNLSWASSSSSSNQWATTGGFWDDSSSKLTTNKPSTVSKSNSTNTFNVNSSTKQQQQQQAQQKQNKNKTKKEEVKANNNNNGPATDEFTTWCYKTLAKISTNIDIPTFVTFLRDIESAFDVREYCKDYLGESNATLQFASNFLEKRRSFKPKNNAHKDDMCSPAPAITPSLQHSTEFQEVKGKNKKNKKSKMLKVDSRILGFNVTSAPDRINVGDRDYGDNS